MSNTMAWVRFWLYDGVGQMGEEWEVGMARFSGRGFPGMRWGEGGKEVCGVRRGQCYPGEAPSASATRRKVGRKGKDAGRCTITRRTETSTRAPSFNNRSRSVQT